MKFEVGKYYRTTHKVDGKSSPVRCIIKVTRLYDSTCSVKMMGTPVIDAVIIRCPSSSVYNVGIETNWYADWCFNTTELSNAEALAIEL